MTTMMMHGGQQTFWTGIQDELTITGSSLCSTGHTWIWAGDPNTFPTEGMLCACGMMEWHKERCPTCGTPVVKPKLHEVN